MARKPGCGPLAALMIFIFVVLMGNEGVGFYYTNCDEEDGNFLNCLMNEFDEEEEEVEEGTVVATGVYNYKDYAITVVANIPLKGGAVTGTVSGSCSGQVKGNYSAQTGVIGGRMTGVCEVFLANIPASAEYSGSVNKSGKTVPISFTGRGAGITHNGSMVLTY